MAIFDFLVNKKPLRKQRDLAKDFAREAYNPNIFNELVNMYREQSVEGISTGTEEQYRTKTLRNLFREESMSLYGGNQASAIAGSQARTESAQQALAGFESDLAIADEQVMQEGRQGFGQTKVQQGQVSSQQKAAIKEADLQYEAEVERRGQKIGQNVLKMGVLGATIAGGGNPLSLLGIGDEKESDIDVEMLAESARAGVTAGQEPPEDILIEDILSEFVPVPMGGQIPTTRQVMSGQTEPISESPQLPRLPDIEDTMTEGTSVEYDDYYLTPEGIQDAAYNGIKPKPKYNQLFDLELSRFFKKPERDGADKLESLLNMFKIWE